MTDQTPIENRMEAFRARWQGKVGKMLIGGEWREAASGETFSTEDPSTGEKLADVAAAGQDDVDAAVAAARAAFEGPWSKVKPQERARLINRLADLIDQHGDELALTETLDVGRPIAFSRMMDVGGASGQLRYQAGWATKLEGSTNEISAPGEWLSYVAREPVGVCAQIVPWNFPLAMGRRAFPTGVLNVVTGDGEPGAALAAHPGVDKVAFTGSTETGQAIVRASAGNVKRVSLELGGKSPDIVFADADLDAAVPGAAMAVFANSGQICSAGTRLFVERKIYEEFTQRVAEFSRTLRLGNGADPDTQIGPLVSAEHLDRVTGYLRLGSQEGARTIAGGARATEGTLANGYFVPPTVFADVKDEMRIAREEIFGPVISAIPFDDIDDVVRRSNTTVFGLGSGVWTTDMRKAHRLAKELRAGSVWINCYNAMDPAVPFGGYKMSGYGRESGLQHVEEFLNVKAVWIKTA